MQPKMREDIEKIGRKQSQISRRIQTHENTHLNATLGIEEINEHRKQQSYTLVHSRLKTAAPEQSRGYFTARSPVKTGSRHQKVPISRHKSTLFRLFHLVSPFDRILAEIQQLHCQRFWNFVVLVVNHIVSTITRPSPYGI